MADLFTCFTSGTVAHMHGCTSADSMPWNLHPSCAGVQLKHLVTGSATEGRFSVHLVKLDPGAEICEHMHDTSWELHEVAGGDGYCVLGGVTIPYTSGVAAVLPETVQHRVQAGENGLLIMAKFIPALL